MPSLEILRRYASRPTSHEWEDSRVYLAGNGAKAIFKNPSEFRMGCYSWDLEVFESGTKKLAAKSGLICPDLYQPWNHGSNCLFLISMKEGGLIYQVISGATRRCSLDGVVGCAGSRRFPLFLVITVTGQFLVGQDGGILRELDHRRPLHGFPFLSWFDGAGLFFAVESQGAGLANLRFFDARTGNDCAAEPIHPSSLFPYAEEKYKWLRRDSWVLVLSEARQCIGSLLDQWSSITFDESAGVLRMMVYRPVGEIFERQSQQVCHVEENWVEVLVKP